MSKRLKYLRKHLSDINKVLLFIITVVLLVFLYPRQGKFKYEYSRNNVWSHQDLLAPFDFAIQKSSEELKFEEQSIINKKVLYFSYDDRLSAEKIAEAEFNFQDYWQRRQGDTLTDVNYYDNKIFFTSLLGDILYSGIYKSSRELDKTTTDHKCIVINTDNFAQEKEFGSMFSIDSANRLIDQRLNEAPDFIEKEILSYVLKSNLVQNLVFNDDLTAKELQNQIDRMSFTRGMIRKDEIVITKGELITDTKFQILESLKSEYEGQLGSSGRFIYVLSGQIILIILSLGSFFIYMMIFRKDIVTENKSLVLIILVLGIIVALTSLALKYEVDYIYAIPFCLIPVMIRAFFDIRLALFIQFMSVVLLGFMVPNSFEFVFLQLIAGIVTIISIQNLQSRSQFFITSIWVSVIYSISYVGLVLMQEGSFDGIIWMNFLWFAISGSLLLFSYPLIYIFEKIFGRVTDVTLLELSNTNRKLLRDMATRAPGTFQHSLQVGNLAESAIYEIGGNALLVRTGALYHDLGKMQEPLYFTENQSTGINPHDELSYDESAQVIVGHVLNGIEIAKKNRLPEPIIDFIRTHHGTRKAEYFYIMQQKENPDIEIDPALYTYPGPKPYSKETSVFMMADSVEAASRSIKFPDEQNIENLINSIIDKQLGDGQFNNANITLREISTVKRIFKEKLMNIYHVRIAYPEK